MAPVNISSFGIRKTTAVQTMAITWQVLISLCF